MSTTTTAPATAEQQARIAELYESRAVPEEKKRGTETYSKAGAARWIKLLEAYPLKEETSANGAKPKATRSRAKAQPAEPKTERKPIDPKLAQRVVTMRAKLDGKGKPTSWAKVAYALKLVPDTAPKAQAGDAARRAYRQIKGADAPTGPSDY